MPDHLQDPCAGCEKCHGYVNSEPICDAEFQECLEWRVYDARRDLLERLKGEGVKVDRCHGDQSAFGYTRFSLYHSSDINWQSFVPMESGPGWLVWIPE